ncbi:unnamed protein product (macronuclear) [Paramecium tetraurelia]|uniref:Chromosome undetermined scaffold_1, whole genome shotgun sequence n=1 Tax=Paramecium tetraurelia TaxID=5888 RepID=Q6BG65_PARTE|nr:hypothetical protein [Paramecium tetraurelia strain d4-2]XP_001423336.1 uncharacterized protein GSPATT00000373001 [Paramecium tetraurelia]CAH03355.1 hypothetical protein PTMB.157c [Paramecium tetraurelia]CAK55938.1 unnamed protein product [Paramecium tetraurelia]|eukprot:XP_001423336.1 hypothetical protein (macronuclear) [Paramecium tetraurelia strain d4-2]
MIIIIIQTTTTTTSITFSRHFLIHFKNQSHFQRQDPSFNQTNFQTSIPLEISEEDHFYRQVAFLRGPLIRMMKLCFTFKIKIDENPHLQGQNFNKFRQKNSNLDKYMQKRTIPIQNEELNKNEPYIKVTVLRNINYPNTNHSNEYFINQHGLIGSHKIADSEDILIGRSHRTDVYPNDITLPEDRIISRIHCKLVCKHYFRKEQKIKLIYKLAIQSIRTSSNSSLPKRALSIISQFLECPRHAYVQDLGSLCGTLFKIQKHEPNIMKYDQKYSIGSDTNFNVQHCESYNEKGIEIDDNFYRLLRKFNRPKVGKHEIHFNDQSIFQKFQRINPQDDDSEDTKTRPEDFYYKLKEYKVAFISIKFNGSGIDNGKHNNIFIHLENSDSIEFQIGRGQENNVKINSNTISRKQSRFKYSKSLKSWVIFDGSKDRDSANGTWVFLSTTDQAEKKQESDLIVLKNNAEIKISEFILKIEMFQGKKQSKINQQLLNELKGE